eukprot:5749682-Karenia_brevis.AAC.1
MKELEEGEGISQEKKEERKEEKREGWDRPEKRRKEGVIKGEESRDSGRASRSNIGGDGNKDGE